MTNPLQKYLDEIEHANNYEQPKLSVSLAKYILHALDYFMFFAIRKEELSHLVDHEKHKQVSAHMIDIIMFEEEEKHE